MPISSKMRIISSNLKSEFCGLEILKKRAIAPKFLLHSLVLQRKVDKKQAG